MTMSSLLILNKKNLAIGWPLIITFDGFYENCLRRKLPPSFNSNTNHKPNPDLDRGGAIFRTPFWCLKELKMWISDALFEQKRFSFDNLTHVVFWTKSELFYKNQLEVSPQITISESTKCGREKPIHAIHAKTTSNSRRNNKNLNTLSLQVPTKCTPFYN